MEAIIFDLGNVLLPFEWDVAAERFCVRTGCTRRELDDYMVTTPLMSQLSLGEMTKEDFYRVISEEFGFDGSYEEFALLWSDIFTTDDEMVLLAEQLRGRYRRYILSNTNPIHTEFICARYPFVHGFDGMVLSHEVGLMKPDRRIYELAIERFALRPSETVFIDDILINVEAAEAAGLRGIHHRDADRTRQELTKLGISGI